MDMPGSAMQTINQNSFCFCTAAYGQLYRNLCRRLAQDLERNAPGKTLIIYTDKASEFDEFKNTECYEEPMVGIIGAYHYRRFSIRKALQKFDFCICIDADVRIIEPVDLKFTVQPGLTARSCCSYNKHEHKILDGTQTNKGRLWEYSVFCSMAEKMGIDPQNPELTWVNEFMFIVARDSGREIEFLDWWDRLALYAQLRRCPGGPCLQIALGAFQLGFEIRRDEMPGLTFFDDRIYLYYRERGAPRDERMEQCLVEQQSLESKKVDFLGKVKRKLISKPIKRMKFELGWLQVCMQAIASPDREFLF